MLFIHQLKLFFLAKYIDAKNFPTKIFQLNHFNVISILENKKIITMKALFQMLYTQHPVRVLCLFFYFRFDSLYLNNIYSSHYLYFQARFAILIFNFHWQKNYLLIIDAIRPADVKYKSIINFNDHNNLVIMLLL